MSVKKFNLIGHLFLSTIKEFYSKIFFPFFFLCQSHAYKSFHPCFRPIEIPFGDKDQLGDYSLQSGDIIEFNIATDRRDELQRATNIILIEDTFKVNGEKRETVSVP